ncbi:MAG: hypothetical protein ACK2TT_03055 [Anaerolineales bacterium]
MNKYLVTSLLVFSLLLGTAACQGQASPTNSVLALEEHPLEGPPDPDTGIFLPVGTSQEAVLAQHQAERQRSVANYVEFSDQAGGPVMASRGSGETLSAVLLTSENDPPRQIVELHKGDQVVFSVDAGLPSPALPLQSLWSYDGHWVLEILYSEDEIWQGRIYRDGQLLNDTENYLDAFGFQLLGGKPFYFYQREDGLGYYYDGQENPLPYQEILHYGCCSASTLNPQPAENMVAFYAHTGDDWYYVELGNFSED